MNIRVLAATVAGAITMFVLGYLIFGLALAEYMRANTVQYPGLMVEPPRFIPLFLANLVWAWLIAYIFEHWARIRTFASGLIGGSVIMLPIALAVDLQYLAFMNIWTSTLPMFIDVIAVTVMGAIVGGVIGLVLGMMDKQPAAAE